MIKDLAGNTVILTPSITFHQPLWLKAIKIVSSKKTKRCCPSIWFSLSHELCRKCWCQYDGFFDWRSCCSKFMVLALWNIRYVGKCFKNITRWILLCMWSCLISLCSKKNLQEKIVTAERKKNVTTIEILSHEEVIELKEMYENLSYTDFNSEKLDVTPLRKQLKIYYQNEQIYTLQFIHCNIHIT